MLIGIGIGVGVCVGVGGLSFDPDAQAFFDRVTTAGGTLSATEKTAVNQLVLDMKSSSIWSKMKAIYPMVGASSDACKQNLINSSYTGSFTSGWTFASTGATPNGINAYMNTNLVPSADLTLNSIGLSVYSRTNTGGTVQKAEIACAFGGSYLPLIQLAVKRYENGGINQYVNQLYSYNDGEGRVYVTNTDSRGFYTTSRTSPSLNKSYKNGIIVGSNTDVISQTQPSVPLYISALNANNTTVQDYSDRELAFVSIGDGLTDTDASSLYTMVQAFQTTLSRQV